MMERKFLIASSVAVLLLWGCDVKDPIYETDHPEHGKITLTTNWDDRTSGIDIPSNYTIKAGDYSSTVSGVTNTVNNLFAPGNYSLYVYNTADNIGISNTTATANYATGTLGWFFSCAMDVTVKADTDHAFTAVMCQQVRQLTLIIEPTGGTTERIESITAVLSGVAGSYDMAGDVHGGATTIPLTFAKDSDGKWKTTVRLLGVTGSEQKLTGTITFTGGSPVGMALESNLTTALAAFNADKKTPLTLGSEIVETPTETGFTATITDWKSVNGGSVIAN